MSLFSEFKQFLSSNNIGTTIVATVISSYITELGVSFSDNIILPDDKKIQLGADQDLEILHDPSNGIIRSISSGGNMHVESKNHIELNVNYNPSSGSKENALKAIANAGVTLYYNGLGKFSTTNTLYLFLVFFNTFNL